MKKRAHLSTSLTALRVGACAGVSLLALLPVVASSAEFSARSEVIAATLHPNAGIVERASTINISSAGVHQLIIEGLPENIDLSTVQVALGGDGNHVISVDRRQVAVDGSTDDPRKRLADEIKAVNGEMNGLNHRHQAINNQRQYLNELSISPNSETSVDQHLATLNLISERLGELSEQEQALNSKRTQLNEKLQALRIEQSQLGAPNTRASELLLLADVATPGEIEVRLSYLSQRMGWSPLYDIVLAADNKVTIISKADVRQSSGEDWSNVALTLSTARTGFGGQLPEVATWYVDPKPQAPALGYKSSVSIPMNVQRAQSQIALESEIALADVQAAPRLIAQAPSPTLNESVSSAVDLGFAADFRLDKPISLASSGSSRAIRLSHDVFEAELKRRSAPIFDQTVYLFASIKNIANRTFLPGRTNLYRGTRYVGSNWIEGLQPNAEADIAFGADERVEIERIDKDRGQGDQGLLGRKAAYKRNYETVVTNYYDTPINVTILDVFPKSENEAIEISLLRGTTAGYVLDAEDTPGVIAWITKLDANGTEQVNYGYQVVQPDNFPAPHLPARSQ